MHYEVRVDFDSEHSDIFSSETYFAVVDKYDAVAIGHEKDGTSTLFFNSDEPVFREELEEDLGDLEILSFEGR